MYNKHKDYDFRSCKNCNYFLFTRDGDAVCNAFHQIGGIESDKYSLENQCPDFEEMLPHKSFVNCNSKLDQFSKQDLEELSDYQVNIFNKEIGISTVFSTENIECNKQKVLHLSIKRPQLIIRINGNCPLVVSTLPCFVYSEKHSYKQLYLKDPYLKYQNTIYIEGCVNATLNLTVGVSESINNVEFGNIYELEMFKSIV